MKGAIPMLAEVNDITRSVFDGIDSLVICFETCKGDFFTETIKSVKYIILEAER
jgi:pyruvate kinase